MQKKHAKRPRDPAQLAKLIIDIATGMVSDPLAENVDSSLEAGPPPKGRAGGIKGGVARASALSPEQRKEIAKRAAAARWRKSK